MPDNVRTDLRLKYQMLVLDMIWFFNSEKNHECYVPSDDPCTLALVCWEVGSGVDVKLSVIRVHELRRE